MRLSYGLSGYCNQGALDRQISHIDSCSMLAKWYDILLKASDVLGERHFSQRLSLSKDDEIFSPKFRHIREISLILCPGHRNISGNYFADQP